MTKFIVVLNAPGTEREEQNEATGEWGTVCDYTNHIIEADTKGQAMRQAHIDAGFDYDNGELAASRQIMTESEFSQASLLADFS